jgi:hypothetical protein
LGRVRQKPDASFQLGLLERSVRSIHHYGDPPDSRLQRRVDADVEGIIDTARAFAAAFAAESRAVPPVEPPEWGEPAEGFTEIQTIRAIESFLEYGEQEFGKSQQGYFSGNGWAARCLRAHVRRLREAADGK